MHQQGGNDQIDDGELKDSADVDLGVAQDATRVGMIASVLYTRRFHPCVVAARTLAQSGSIGPLLTAECRFLTTQVKFRHPESWLFNAATRGAAF